MTLQNHIQHLRFYFQTRGYANDNVNRSFYEIFVYILSTNFINCFPGIFFKIEINDCIAGFLKGPTGTKNLNENGW